MLLKRGNYDAAGMGFTSMKAAGVDMSRDWGGQNVCETRGWEVVKHRVKHILDEQYTTHGKLNIACFGCNWILLSHVQITLLDEMTKSSVEGGRGPIPSLRGRGEDEGKNEVAGDLDADISEAGDLYEEDDDLEAKRKRMRRTRKLTYSDEADKEEHDDEEADEKENEVDTEPQMPLPGADTEGTQETESSWKY
ncbi:hypothetical protein RUND412_000176 [Rhizina undulata]